MHQGFLSRLLAALYQAAGFLAALFLVLIAATMFGMSLGRLVGINIPSGDDFAGWCMAAMAFLALAHTFKNGDLLRIGLLIDRFPFHLRKLVEVICLVLAAGLAGFMAWHIVLMNWHSYQFSDMSSGVIAVPLWIPQLGMSAGIILITVALIDSLVRLLLGLDPGHQKKKPATREEFLDQVSEGNL